MKFFMEEILENETVKAYMSEADPLAHEGKMIARQMAQTGKIITLEPGMLPVYALAYLADYALEQNNARGIPRQITVETLKDVNIWLDNYDKQFGKMGIGPFHWLSRLYLGRVFCLGRLQFLVANAPDVVPSGPFVLTTHIPQGKPLTKDACLDSFSRAKEFYAQYFPEKPAEYFTCHSWLLAPNLAEILPEESNIVQFMRMWVQYPCQGDNSAQAMERVFGFGFDRQDLSKAPEETSLQKKMKEYLLAGGDLSACSGYRKI